MPRGKQQSWKGSERAKRGGRKKKKKVESDTNSSNGSTSNSSSSEGSSSTNQANAVSPIASILIPQREKWSEAPAYIRGYWDINQIEGDPGLESLIANNYFLDSKTIEPLPWGKPGSTTCKTEVKCLSEMCRDSELHARGIAPETPLHYLEELAVQTPSSFTHSDIQNIVLVLNGEDVAQKVYTHVSTILSILGPIVFDDVGSYIRDPTRPDPARICAARVIGVVCLRNAYTPTWRRGGLILASALVINCKENSIALNTSIANIIYEIRYLEGLHAIKKAINLSRVDVKVAMEYNEVMQRIQASKMSLASQMIASGSDSKHKKDLKSSITVTSSNICPHCGEEIEVCSKKLTLVGTKMLKDGLKSLNMGYCETACRSLTGGIAWLIPSIQNRSLSLYAESLMFLGRYEEAASAFSESCASSEFPLGSAITSTEIQRVNGHLPDALYIFASAAATVAASPNGKEYTSTIDSYIKYLIEEEEGGNADYDDDDDDDDVNQVYKVVIADWDHPIIFPALPLQVSLPSASSSLTVSEKCFAVISSQHKVEVGQFNDPFAYYSQVSTSSSSSSSKESKRPFSPLRSIKSLGVEGCKALSADPGGSAVAAILRDSQSVTVWELKADYSREIPLGPALRPPEHVVCGGHLGCIVAASSQSVITVWNWPEAGDSPNHGPFYLAATRGKVTAMAIDSTATIADAPSEVPSSLFAAVCESKRTCILEYDLQTRTLLRTLLGISDILRSTDSAPVSPLPVIATIACCSSHVAASTLCGSLHVWERRNAHGKTSVRHMYCIKSLLEHGSGSRSNPANSAASCGSSSGESCTPSMGCAVSLAFVPGVLLCGLQCGHVVGYDVCHPGVERGQPLFRIRGPCLPISSISPLVRGSELLLRFAYSGCLISTFLFNLRERGSEVVQGEMPLKCSACEKELDPSGPLMKCGGCMKVLYCSLKCQKSDWKKHSLICKHYD